MMVKITNNYGYMLDTLRDLERQRHDVRMRLCYMAIRLVWEGCPATAVTHIVGFTSETVSTYVRAWNAAGPDGLVIDIDGAVHPCQGCVSVHQNSRVQEVLAQDYPEVMDSVMTRFLFKKKFTN